MITSLSEVWPSLTAAARAEGVLGIGASDLQDAHATLFESWIDRGDHATMSYLERHRQVRVAPTSRFPWARSVIAILVPYSSRRPDSSPGSLAAGIARYALGDDYHEVLDGILRRFEEVIAAHAPGARTWRYVDTGPLSDRAMAAQAGLGWIAKNGMLINEQIGSYTFIGTLLTSLSNDIGSGGVADRCGTCTRCIDGCPTDAILTDRTIASERCISHATIEQRGPLDEEMTSRLGGNVFGCDICQEVCPWNHDPAESHPAFAARAVYAATPITDLLRFEQEDFSTLFQKSAIKRAKLAGMQRNVAAVLRSKTPPPHPESREGRQEQPISEAMRRPGR